MKRSKKIAILVISILIFLNVTVYAHGGNISGWKDKKSSKIVEANGKYYGYHKEDGVVHYHTVEWDEENERWKIINPAVYYDENLNIIETVKNTETEKIEVKYHDKVDGDTAEFELDGEIIKVRFLGVNTPETVATDVGEEPFGKEASNYTTEKLENATTIKIEYDSNADKKDKYERVLAWVWVDDSLLQEELVKNGLAETYMLQNNYTYASELQLAEEEAKNNKLGIWSGEDSNVSTSNVDSAGEINNNVNIDNTTNTEDTVSDENESLDNTESENILVFAVAIISAILAIAGKTRKKRR